MTDEPTAAQSSSAAKSIEQLKEQYEELNKRKIQAQTQLESATKQLEDLQKEAVENFQTSDITELKAKLAEMEAENEKRRADYQKLLEDISSDLAAVEKDASKAPTKEPS